MCVLLACNPQAAVGHLGTHTADKFNQQLSGQKDEAHVERPKSGKLSLVPCTFGKYLNKIFIFFLHVF